MKVKLLGITSNKSQGQTPKWVGLYIDRPFFSHGQYYVGQSRVGEKSGLRILVTDGTYQGKPGEWTDKVVYPEVLVCVSYFPCMNLYYSFQYSV